VSADPNNRAHVAKELESLLRVADNLGLQIEADGSVGRTRKAPSGGRGVRDFDEHVHGPPLSPLLKEAREKSRTEAIDAYLDTIGQADDAAAAFRAVARTALLTLTK